MPLRKSLVCRRLFAATLAVSFLTFIVASAQQASFAGPGGAGLTGPRVVALGTVQDGGLPHAGCHCRRCTAARADPAKRRHVAALGIVLPAEKKLFLLDATPDLPAQLEMLTPYRGEPAPERVDRGLLSGILLTHAHMGHYLGLAHLGFEVMHTQGVPVYATPRMAGFLSKNGPWDQLVRLGEISLREVPPGTTVELGEGVRFTSLAVPHRDEYSDTVAYLLRGPRASVFYVPDTDTWATWPRPLPEVLQGVDVALLDGTFYSADELPGRDVTKIGHPLITATLDLLAPQVASGKLRVLFTHLNHSNPALEEGSEARRAIEARGFAVLAEGQELPL